MSGEQRQPLPFVNPLTPQLLRGLRACLSLPTPCVPPNLADGSWRVATASGLGAGHPPWRPHSMGPHPA